eukprot:g3263.t1
MLDHRHRGRRVPGFVVVGSQHYHSSELAVQRFFHTSVRPHVIECRLAIHASELSRQTYRPSLKPSFSVLALHR